MDDDNFSTSNKPIVETEWTEKELSRIVRLLQDLNNEQILHLHSMCGITMCGPQEKIDRD